MNKKQYVQHVSGQGQKWALEEHQGTKWASWVAAHTEPGGGMLYLPKSEYRICDPPEVWRDVTERCEITQTGLLRMVNDDKTHTYINEDYGYRFLKTGLWKQCDTGTYHSQPAFIVEKKES